MSHGDVYLLLLAVSCAIFTYAAVGRYQPKTVALVPLGLAVLVLGFFLKSAGWL